MRPPTLLTLPPGGSIVTVKTSSVIRLTAIVGLLLILTSCAAGPNDLAGGPGAAGFWLGLWQGLISPITFIVSLFNDNVNIYEVHNNGNWYNFGFMVGVACVFSGGAGTSCTASRRGSRRSDC